MILGIDSWVIFREIALRWFSQDLIDQSGTKPNLAAKILATNSGVFFVI